jgi:PKD repeat protein
VSRPTVRLFLFFTIVLTAACDKVPLLAPTQSTITLSVSTTTLSVNGTAQVIATVIEQPGTPVQNGTLVTFTGSLGSFDPPEATTVNGKATSTFRANGTSGTAKLGAVSGSAKATEVEVKIGGAAAESVTLRAEPSNVPVTGGTVQLVAVVTDVSGNALPGTPVVFSADNGQLGSNSVVTDSTGEARTSLTTNRTSIVKARVGTKEGQVTINATTLPTVSIAANPASPLAGLPVTFTITPGAAGTTGSPIRNVVLDFGDGTAPANLGAVSGAASVSHIYVRAGTYTVTATVTDLNNLTSSNSVSLTVTQPIVNVSFTNPPSTGQAGTQVTFQVAVTNSSNVPITGVVVNFGDGQSITLPPSGGSAPHTYSQAGTYTVSATATAQGGGQFTATTQITIAPPTAFDVTLDAESAEATSSMSCVPATGYPKTCNMNFVGGGVRVRFTAGCTGGFGAGACTNAVGYQWNYGDGSPVETTTQRQVDHVFRSRGEFVITVLVQTNTGAQGTQRLTLIVQ